MSVCVDTKLSELEAALSVVMGGATSLSDPSNNISDPLVQIAIHAVGGLCELETALEEFKNGFNIATASCDCLTILATLIGETQLTNKASSVSISATGTNNTVIPAGTTYSDNFANTWTLQDQITIINGWGWGVANSAAGSYSVNTSELIIDTPIDNVNTTNGQMIEQGYLTEDCESFRTRLMSGGGSSIVETQGTIINKIESLGAKVTFIGNAPDCISPYTNNAFVVNGGTDSDIANILMNYAPINYTTLAGNVEYVVNDCETVRFLRPCPVGIEINYWGRSEIDDQEFIDVLCNSTSKCESNSITAMNFANISKLKQISIRPIYTRNSSVSSTDDTSAIDCFGSVSLISDDCHCTGDVVDQPITDCIDIESWQYPVFVSATYNGESC